MWGLLSEDRAWTRHLIPSTLLMRTSLSNLLSPIGAPRSLNPRPQGNPQHFTVHGVRPSVPPMQDTRDLSLLSWRPCAGPKVVSRSQASC